jgi:hypothetical protein
MARFMSFMSTQTKNVELVDLDLVKRIFTDAEWTTTIEFTDGWTMTVLDTMSELLHAFEDELEALGLTSDIAVDARKLTN